MPNSAPSRPAKPFSPYPLQRILRTQAWVTLLALAIGLVIDVVIRHDLVVFVVSKNLLVGCVIAWLGQVIFAKISLGLSGYQQRRQIVHRFYLAHLIKWLFTLVGFGMAFRFLRPLQAGWVLGGFMLLQISYVVSMYRQRI